MKWRVIPLHTTDAFTAMAIDEAVSQFVISNDSPTIRFWRWNPSAVSIGYFQSLRDEVNLEKCKDLGFDVVRRVTGGGAVFHDYNGEITYSVIAPENFFSSDIIKSYSEICGWIIRGLNRIGLSASFVPINDIVINGKKISGNAQTRRNNVLHQHGTILYDLDVKRMFSVLRVSKEKISDKMIKAVEERVTRILNFVNLPLEEVYNNLLQGFVEGKDWELGELTNEEIELSKKLAETKYKTEKWNFMK